MPGFRKVELAKRITQCLILSNVRIRSAAFSGVRGYLPWRITVEFPNNTIRKYGIYMWTISHGGLTRSREEYRIQMMLEDDQRKLDFGFGTTLLLGYYDERNDRVGRTVGNLPVPGMELVVAWNPIQHLQLGASSSCQVSFDLLEEAYRKGMAARTRLLSRGESEQTIAMRPEYFASYLAEVSGGHHLVVPQAIMNRQLQGWRF